MARILIVYSTTDGHTKKICLRLKELIEKYENPVTLIAIEEASSFDLNVVDKIVVGASIRYGKHSPQVYEFIRINRQCLDSKANAFFTVNVVARKPEKNKPDTNPYLKKFLKQIAWKPKHLAVFAGRIDYSRYKFWDRQAIRFIMWITKGPTDPETNIEFTDWNQVENFARVINEM